MTQNALKANAAPAWSRRRLMRALAGAAAIPVLHAAGAPLPRTGIVGAGMAGVSLAWLLDGQRDVLLLEAQPETGGNIETEEVNLDGYNFVVDLGAQYFNPGPYPTYVKLLSLLGLTADEYSFAASITLFDPSESTPRFVSPVLPQRVWPLLALWNWTGLGAFATAFPAAQQLENENASWDLTMEAWLQSLNLSEQQSSGMIVPWAASLYSGSIEEAMGYSARAAMIFAAEALPANPLQPVMYSVLNSGMAEVLSLMLAQTSTVQVLTGTPVIGIERGQQGGFTLYSANGRVFPVDELVLACSGPPALSLLASIPGTELQQAALAGIEFRPSRLALHTDPIYAPANPLEWSFFNAEIEGGYCEASMWLANVLSVSAAPNRGEIVEELDHLSFAAANAGDSRSAVPAHGAHARDAQCARCAPGTSGFERRLGCGRLHPTVRFTGNGSAFRSANRNGAGREPGSQPIACWLNGSRRIPSSGCWR